MKTGRTGIAILGAALLLMISGCTLEKMETEKPEAEIVPIDNPKIPIPEKPYDPIGEIMSLRKAEHNG